MPHLCNNAEFEVFGFARSPYDVVFDLVRSDLLSETDGIDAKQLIHFRYGLCEAFIPIPGHGKAAQPSSTERVSSRYYVKFVGTPFAVEMPDWEVYQDMRQIDTREERIDAIAEYHWCPKEHDLIYDGAAEDARDCSACGREAGRGFGRLCCKACAFHLCGACRIPQRGAPCR